MNRRCRTLVRECEEKEKKQIRSRGGEKICLSRTENVSSWRYIRSGCCYVWHKLVFAASIELVHLRIIQGSTEGKKKGVIRTGTKHASA